MRKRGRSRKEQQLDFISVCDEMASKKPIMSAAENFRRKPYSMLERGDKLDNEQKK